MRYLFYTPSDGRGVGHIRRNLAVAAAVVGLDSEGSVLFVHGTDAGDRLDVPPRVDLLRLPAVRRSGDGSYALPRSGGPIADVLALRSAVLRAAVESYLPDVLLVDKHPMGAKGDVAGALEAQARRGGRTVLGLRDILDDGDSVRRNWEQQGALEMIEQRYEAILVYGQPEIFDAVTAYDLSPSLAARTTYCGYVLGVPVSERAPARMATAPRARPLVLATPGGGEDGFGLLAAFLQAAAGAPWDGVVVTGPQAVEDEIAVLRRLAERAGVVLHRFLDELGAHFATVDAIVCMGGYNTLTEAVSSGTPTVCVPRVPPSAEQLLRARAFARRGFVRLLEPVALDPASLAAEVAAVLDAPRAMVTDRRRAVLRTDGASRAAVAITGLARGVPAAPAPLPDVAPAPVTLPG